MADDGRSGDIAAAGRARPSDRELLTMLAEEIDRRARMKAMPGPGRGGSPEDSKKARLERQQGQLKQLLDDAIGRPAIRTAFEARGLEMDTLRAAGQQGRWNRSVAPAVEAAGKWMERPLDEQRQAGVTAAAQAITHMPENGGWLDDLEGKVRASFGRVEPDHQAVAVRFIEWAEEAMEAVSQPLATAAKAAIVRRAYEVELDGQDRPTDDRLGEALRRVIERQDDRPAAEAARPDRGGRQVGEDAVPANRILAPDDGESASARRQLADFAEISSTQEAPREAQADPTGLFSRLSSLLSRKQGGEALAPPRDDESALPDTLRKRYAVHVSDDRKRIELYETGAKTPAITLDARAISTRHDDGVVVADVVALARDRGWQTLRLTGSETFKDAVWLEATKHGLGVQHEPSAGVRAAYAKWESERPANEVRQGATLSTPTPLIQRDDLAMAFMAKSSEERLADPRLRNAQLELMIGIRTAEKELKRPIREMPEVAQALAAAIREQLKGGRVFDAPFVKPDAARRATKQVAQPKIDADRIPPPRP